MLPDISGEEICRFIRSKSRVPIIMLTAKVDESSELFGFRIGADDYLTKPFSPRVLMVRVEALLRRSKDKPTAQTLSFNNGALSIDIDQRKVIKNDILIHLTPIEFNILQKIISHPNRVYTREDIILSVMGSDFDGIDRTIDSHIRNLRYKIEENPKEPQYILTKRGIGFYFNGK
jgi:DNA-binding response OmpR family regulator